MNPDTLRQITPARILDFFKKVDKRTWIKTGLGAFLILILGLLIIWPAWFQRVEIRGKIKNLEGQINTLHTLTQKKAEWLRNKEEYSNLIRDAKAKLYEPGEGSLLLGAISKLAKESKVSIVASQPKDYPDKFPAPFDARYEGTLYDFTLEGGYHDFGNFVSRIESHPKLLRIQLFNLKAKDGAPKVHTAAISLSAISFQKEKA